MQAIWKGILNQVQEISLPIFQTVNPPASLGEIDYLENMLGQSLPDDFKSYLYDELATTSLEELRKEKPDKFVDDNGNSNEEVDKHGK